MSKKTFKGRALLTGEIDGKATVSHIGFNTFTSYKKNMSGAMTDKAVCDDGDNKDLYGKDITGAILCLPQTIGSTTGGFVLMGVVKMGVGPKAMLFSRHVDSLAIGGLLMTDIWVGERVIVVDLLGDEFLETVKTGDPIKVSEDGTVEVG
jgi:predicted aconitase with swiveling domain